MISSPHHRRFGSNMSRTESSPGSVWGRSVERNPYDCHVKIEIRILFKKIKINFFLLGAQCNTCNTNWGLITVVTKSLTPLNHDVIYGRPLRYTSVNIMIFAFSWFSATGNLMKVAMPPARWSSLGVIGSFNFRSNLIAEVDNFKIWSNLDFPLRIFRLIENIFSLWE